MSTKDRSKRVRKGIILSSMPVAFMALIPPSICDLDFDLAGICWLINTALLAVIIPSLLFVIHTFWLPKINPLTNFFS